MIFRKITYSLVGTILAFIVTAIMNFFTAYYAFDKGTIVIGPNIKIGNENYISLDVTNFSTEYLKPIRVIIPSDSDIKNISASNFASITLIQSLSENKKIEISGIDAYQHNLILIPVKNWQDDDVVKVTNAKESSVRVVYSEEISNPYAGIFREALFQALFSAVVYFSFLIIFIGLIDSVKDENSKLMQRTESIGNEVVSTRSEVRRVEERAVKHQILLQSRIADYAKELNFWRDLISKIVLNGGGDKTDINKLKELVTDSLETYGTKDKPADFKYLEIVAKILEPKKE